MREVRDAARPDRTEVLQSVSRRLSEILADISTPDDIAAKPAVSLRFDAAPKMDLPPLLQPTPHIRQSLFVLAAVVLVIPTLLFLGYREEPTAAPTVSPTMFPALAAAPVADQWCEPLPPPPVRPAPPPVSQVPDTALAGSFLSAIARLREAEPPPVDVLPPPRPVPIQTFQRRDLKDMTDAEARAGPRDICRGKGRYYINNGKSWRCRRR